MCWKAFPERLDAYQQAVTLLAECATLANQAADSGGDEAKSSPGKTHDAEPLTVLNYDGHVTAKNYRLRAEELFAKARHISDRNPNSTTDFALFQLLGKEQSFRDSHQALELAQRVLKDYPERGQAWFAVALAHYRNGDWKAAESADQNSMKFSHGDKAEQSPLYDWLLLSMIRFQQGRIDEARQWHKKADDWFAEHKPRSEQLLTLSAEAKTLFRPGMDADTATLPTTNPK